MAKTVYWEKVHDASRVNQEIDVGLHEVDGSRMSEPELALSRRLWWEHTQTDTYRVTFGTCRAQAD